MGGRSKSLVRSGKRHLKEPDARSATAFRAFLFLRKYANMIGMENNFWKSLPKPFFVLAPMAGITDVVFRQIVAECGKPDVVFTPFVSVEGLMSAGREVLIKDLEYLETERPVVAQFFGADPDKFRDCAKLAVELGFDGIDINMGCPDKAVLKQGAGSALIKNPELAKKIIRETKKGADDTPVSVKTRIGFSKNEIETWIPAILEEGIAALTVHLRTTKEMYGGEAHWEWMGRIVELAKRYDTAIIGNGNVESQEDGVCKVHKVDKVCNVKVDGVMIGRAALRNPWAFVKDGHEPTKEERIAKLRRHIELFQKTYGDTKPFFELRKYFSGYISGFPGAKELRVELMKQGNIASISHILSRAG